MEGLEMIIDKDTGSVKSVKDSQMDPSQFDATMKKLLIGQGAEEYVNIFRQHNIGQSTLPLLSDADLIKLGVDDAQTRKNLMNMVQDLPIYAELKTQKPQVNSHLSLKEITDILVESTEHLNRVYMSLYSTTRALSKDGVQDTLLYEDKYASDVAISTVNEIVNIMDSMENALQTKMLVPTRESKQKKIIVGAVGGAVIVTLAILFVRSLKQLK